VNVLRDSMAVDSLDPCGVYFGTTGGQVYGSADSGDSWQPIVRDLPPVLSVEVQTLYVMVRVTLPTHLKDAGPGGGDVELELEPPATIGSALTALEARYPVLREAIRDHVDPPEAELRALLRLPAGPVAGIPGDSVPDAVVRGDEPLMIIGAVAGG
jgi:hypothetical protein